MFVAMTPEEKSFFASDAEYPVWKKKENCSFFLVAWVLFCRVDLRFEVFPPLLRDPIKGFGKWEVADRSIRRVKNEKCIASCMCNLNKFALVEPEELLI